MELSTVPPEEGQQQERSSASHTNIATYQNSSIVPPSSSPEKETPTPTPRASPRSVLKHRPDEIHSDDRQLSGKAVPARPLIVSLEFLNPTHESKLRVSSPLVATFNLIATVCGGGVLSLPLCFARAGIFPTTILMAFCAVTTDFCLYILCSCARRTGGRNYGDVAKSAFGSVAEICATGLLVLS